MLSLVEALTTARVCPCDCHANLTTNEKAKGIAAIYHLDDALRGWRYQPIYDVHGDRLWKEAQKKNDPSYRMVAVRFGECIYRRLLGSMLHECIHAVSGDVELANYGILFGLPYGVPPDVPPNEEESYLAKFNAGEAKAFVGVWILGRRLFDIDWDLRTARDIGTYCFVGGNALVPPIPGYRPVAHIDRNHHADRYYVRGRKLEEEARKWFDENLENVVARIEEAAAVGKAKRPRKYPEPSEIAKLAPRKIGRNEPCVCGSDQKFKDCCALRPNGLAQYVPSLAR